MTASREGRAAALRALHVPGRPVVLPNVWDVASARVVAEAGFPAVATGSHAVAEVLGWPDGERIPAAEMFGAVRRIAAAVDVPVTADVERGYRLSAAELTERLAEAGAVGCNLEDSDRRAEHRVPAAEQADLLAAVRAADPDLVINARVDSFLRGEDGAEQRLADAVERAKLYLEAGADCVYPIGALDAATVRALVDGIGGPVNVLCAPGGPPLAELVSLGVARVSYGHLLHAATQRHFAGLVAAIAAGGDAPAA